MITPITALENYEIILGSSSESRKKIFYKLFKNFKVIPPEINEKEVINKLKEYKSNPLMVAMFLSYQKNLKIQSILKKPNKLLIITFDTIVVHQSEIKNKPRNKNIAKKWLYSYRNDIQEIVTAYSIFISDMHITISNFDTSTVFFKNVPDEEIDKYVYENPVEKWSGGIAIEKAKNFFNIIEGDIDSIIGVPKKKIIKDLEKLIS
ncbi:MAG: Maf family protein [Brevinematia bacterium]